MSLKLINQFLKDNTMLNLIIKNGVKAIDAANALIAAVRSNGLDSVYYPMSHKCETTLDNTNTFSIRPEWFTTPA